MTEFDGGAPAGPPGSVDIWAASTSGDDGLLLEWQPAEGDWTVVLMRADGGAGIDAVVRAGATVPGLTGLAVGLLVAGGVLFGIGVLMVVLPLHRAQLQPPAPGAAVPAPRSPVPGGTPARTGVDAG